MIIIYDNEPDTILIAALCVLLHDPATSYLREHEEPIRAQHFRCMSVHVGTAGCTECAQRVETGHVKHQADVVGVQVGAEELRGGVLQRLQAVAVSQAQEVQHHLFSGGAEAGPARVQVV